MSVEAAVELSDYPETIVVEPQLRLGGFVGGAVLAGFDSDVAASEFFVGSAEPMRYAVNPGHGRSAEVEQILAEGWADYQLLGEDALRHVKVEGELYAKKHPAALDAALWNVRRLYAGSGRYSVVELAVNARYDLHRLTQRLGHDALLEISDE